MWTHHCKQYYFLLKRKLPHLLNNTVRLNMLRLPLLTTQEAAWYIIIGRPCMSVCMYVCLYVCQTMTCESLDARSSYLHMRYISTVYGSSSYMKVIGSRSRSQELKGRKFLFPQCKTSIGNNNSHSIKHRAVTFACSMGFSDTADRMVWPPSLSRDQKWTRVTKCTHSRVVLL